jgi:hypothetical protein
VGYGASPCPSTAITLPITQRTVTASSAGTGGSLNRWSQHTDKFNTYGLQTESDDYDFSATPPGTRLQQIKGIQSLSIQHDSFPLESGAIRQRKSVRQIY